jgi:hypothetical protein
MSEAATIGRVVDRCDRCGAPARVHTVFPDGGELYFCSHHTTCYIDRLCALDAVIAIHCSDL